MALALEQVINAATLDGNAGALQTVTVTYDTSTRKFTFTTTLAAGLNLMILASETVGNVNFSGSLIWDNLGFTDKTANLPLNNGATDTIVPPDIASVGAHNIFS